MCKSTSTQHQKSFLSFLRVTPPVFSDMSCVLLFSYYISLSFSAHVYSCESCNQVSPPTLAFNISPDNSGSSRAPSVAHCLCDGFYFFIISNQRTFHCSLGLQIKVVSMYQFQSDFSQAITLLFSILHKIEDSELNCQS